MVSWARGMGGAAPRSSSGSLDYRVQSGVNVSPRVTQLGVITCWPRVHAWPSCVPSSHPVDMGCGGAELMDFTAS